MNDDKNFNHLLCHSIKSFAGSMHSVHRNYGLWCSGSVGNKSAVNGFAVCPERYFEFYSISHMFEGGGQLWIKDRGNFKVNPGDVVVIEPDLVHRYGGDGTLPYIEDAIQFYGPVADLMRQSGVIESGIFALGPVRRLRPIIELLRDPSIDSQLNGNLALQNLMMDIYNHRRQLINSHSVIEKLLSAIKSQLNRWWTIDDMAEFCQLSNDQMRRLFVRHTGVMPKVYIDRMKIQHAAELLISRQLRIAEIAAELGYVDQYHFSRRFKQIMGLSPRQYREQAPGWH